MSNKLEIYYYCFSKNNKKVLSHDGLENYFQYFLTRTIPSEITMNELENKYVKVYEAHISNEINLDNKESITTYLYSTFASFSSDKNPLSDKKYQKVLRENNLSTFMSIGDIIKLNDTLYCISGSGFTTVLFK